MAKHPKGNPRGGIPPGDKLDVRADDVKHAGIGPADSADKLSIRVVISKDLKEEYVTHAASKGLTVPQLVRLLLYRDSRHELVYLDTAVVKVLQSIGQAVGSTAAAYTAEAERIWLDEQE